MYKRRSQERQGKRRYACNYTLATGIIVPCTDRGPSARKICGQSDGARVKSILRNANNLPTSFSWTQQLYYRRGALSICSEILCFCFKISGYPAHTSLWHNSGLSPYNAVCVWAEGLEMIFRIISMMIYRGNIYEKNFITNSVCHLRGKTFVMQTLKRAQ